MTQGSICLLLTALALAQARLDGLSGKQSSRFQRLQVSTHLLAHLQEPLRTCLASSTTTSGTLCGPSAGTSCSSPVSRISS